MNDEFGRLLEAQVQMDTLRAAFNSQEEGVDPEQVQAVAEGQQILSGATFGKYQEILGTQNQAMIACAQSSLARLRAIRSGTAARVLLLQGDPIDIPAMVNSLITEDTGRRLKRRHHHPSE